MGQYDDLVNFMFNEGNRIMNHDICGFYKRWMAKADNYDTSDLSDCFDKFLTLFTVYNSMYNNLAKQIGFSEKYDNAKATKCVPSVTEFKELCEDEIFKKSSEKITSLIDSGEFYVSDTSSDKKIIKRVKSNDKSVRLQGVLELVYRIRCNLIHGEKEFMCTQKNILQPCINILEIINHRVFSYLDN